MTRVLALSALAVLLAWPVAGQSVCRIVVAAGDPTPSLRADARPVLSAAETEDLVFSVYLPPSVVRDGERVVTVRLEMPGGFFYQQLDVPVGMEEEFAEGRVPTRRKPLTSIAIYRRDPADGCRYHFVGAKSPAQLQIERM